MIFIAGLFIYPFVWIFISSLKDKGSILANPWGLPVKLFFSNYVLAWTKGNLGRAIFNSLFVTCTAVAITIVAACPAAYYFTKVTFRGKFLYYPILMSMVIPTAVLLIPISFLGRKLNILDSYSGLIFPYAALYIPLGIFILSNFFVSLPESLEEAAFLDGASRFQTLIHIIIPISKPAIFSAMALPFIFIWNEFTLALVLVTDSSVFTIPLALKAFAGSYSYEYDLVFAALGIVNLFLFFILIFLQRHFVRGILSGAFKY
ncbi:MAG: carbohydrate ABC transporter permease [Candidatus Atribacteria bacterium]|nr:carbohydrate ABC transporter permease [Candidatus Atribacteria bacterium]